MPFIIPLELPLCIIPFGTADPGAVSGKKHEFCFTETSKESSNVKISDSRKPAKGIYQQMRGAPKLESGNSKIWIP